MNSIGRRFVEALAGVFRGRWIVALLVVVLLLQTPLAASASAWTVSARLVLNALGIGLSVLLFANGRRQERQREALLELANALTGSAELGDRLDRCVSAVTQLVPRAQRCALYLMDPAGQRLNPRYGSRSQLGELRSLDAEEGIVGAALAQGETLRVGDARCVPAAQALSPEGRLRSLVLAPLTVGSERLGLLCLGSARPWAFGAEQIALATMLANHAAIALHLAGLHTTATQERQHSSLVLDSLHDAMVVLDHHHRIVQHNPALATVLGPDLSGLVGSAVKLQSRDARLQRLAYLIGDCSAETPVRKSLTIEEPVHAVLEIDVNPMVDDAGRWLRVVVIHDVSRLADALAEQTRLLRAVAHGMQVPLGALAEAADATPRTHVAFQLERLRQDLLALTEPMEALALTSDAPVPLRAVLDRLPVELPPTLSRGLDIRVHDRLAMQRVNGRWLGHLLTHLIEEIGARTDASQIVLDIEGHREELVFTVRALNAAAPIPWSGDDIDRLGFGASQGALAMLVSRRLAEALGGYLWTQSDHGTPRCQVILPVPGKSQSYAIRQRAPDLVGC